MGDDAAKEGKKPVKIVPAGYDIPKFVPRPDDEPSPAAPAAPKAKAAEVQGAEPPAEVLDLDSLDFGLGVAFAQPKRLPGEGVAAAIDRMVGGGPRVMLPDDSDGPAPMLRVVPGGSDRIGVDGRYELLGEIARGGLGVVLKGRDRDLGRDVAIKVLRPEFAKNDAVLARFVEEAQIGGQLQHPGLVPVYSLGLDSDGRPFFAMKLVKGRTFAAVLVDRKSPREGQRRCLAIFESVCKTMAYAHSRRVVHRDLKPSNVMLGAFGEVQVVDWGLAKVLGRDDVPGVRSVDLAAEISLIATVRSGSAGSGSLAGSVLGTPGYMSPEQAIGRIDDVDERTDVFALGSILCEILTGEPPFTGEARDQILLAATGNLTDAKARLEKCGADPAITAIAMKCLAADREERYRDAGVVADAVSAHLSGAETRARQAEIAAAEANAKAEDERMLAARERAHAARERASQRRTIAVSAVALAAVGAAIVVWRNRAMDETERETFAVAAVSSALAEASALRGEKNIAAAIAAAQRAVALAQAGTVDSETTERAARVLAEFEEEDRNAKVAVVQAAKDAAWTSAMDRAYDSLAWDSDEEVSRVTADRFAAFREYGVDLEKCDVEAGAALLRASSQLAEMAVALDQWVWFLRGRSGRTPASAEQNALIARIEQMARAADPDPFRTRVRDAIASRTLTPELAATIASAPELEAQPTRLLDILVTSFERRGADEAAAKLADVLVRRFPGRPWMAYEAMRALVYDGPRPDRLSPDAYRAAWTAHLAIRPSADRWQTLGIALRGSAEPGAAISALTEATRLAPRDYQKLLNLMHALNAELGDMDDRLMPLTDRAQLIDPARGESHFYRGRVFERAREFTAAAASFRRAIELMPSTANPHVALSGVLVDLRKYDEALTELRTAARLEPTPSNLALVIHRLASQGTWDADAAIAESKKALELFPDDPEILDAVALANRAAAWKANGEGEFTKAIAFADTSVEMRRKLLALKPSDAERHKDLAHSLGTRAQVAGLASQEMIDEYREAIRLEKRPRWWTAHQAHEWLAGELERVGRFEEARSEYSKALRIFPFCAELNRDYGYLLASRYEEYREGLLLLRRAVDLAPDNRQLRIALLNMLHSSQSGPSETRAKPEEIEAEVKRAAKLFEPSAKAEAVDVEEKEKEDSDEREFRLVFDPRYPEKVRNGLKPTDRADAEVQASACYQHRLHLDAVKMVRSGLSRECPADPKPVRDVALRLELLYTGAFSAALAGNGDGEGSQTLDAAARTQLRRQSLAWLRESCGLGEFEVVGATEPGAPVGRLGLLARATNDSDFRSVRDPEALAALPPDERAAWERVWAEIRRALRDLEKRTK